MQASEQARKAEAEAIQRLLLGRNNPYGALRPQFLPSSYKCRKCKTGYLRCDYEYDDSMLVCDNAGCMFFVMVADIERFGLDDGSEG